MDWTGFVKVFDRVPGHGEDAAVCVEWLAGRDGEQGAGCACAGVFDGLGGLGARPVDVPVSAATPGLSAGCHSEAYVASRCARDALVSYASAEGERIKAAFATCADENEVLAEAHRLRQGLEKSFDEAFLQLHGRVGGVLLPTNAAVALRVEALGRAYAAVLWAGDARCYLLDAATGLHQLSRDDNGTGADALADLRGAAPAAQTRRLGFDVTVGGGTHLSLNLVELGAPAVVVCCTDGVYSAGIRSPMHFELLLWRWVLAGGPTGTGLGAQAFSLMDAYWAERAQDDCSIAGFSTGTLDEAWHRQAAARMHEVYARYIAGFPVPPEPGTAVDSEALTASLEASLAAYEGAVDALWDDYKPGYVRYQE